MASLVQDKKNGSRNILLVCPETGKRKTLRLGRVPKRAGEEVKRRVEAIIACRKAGLAWDADLAAWIGARPKELKGKLAAVGLIDPIIERETRLGPFVDQYTESRKSLKPNSLREYGQTRRYLVKHFGENREMGTVTNAEAEAFREAMLVNLAQATVSRHVKRARQFFRAAVDQGAISSNPFKDVKAGSMANKKRQEYVSPEKITKVLAFCPDNEWRLLFALARYAALRIPSEALALTWEDVLWSEDKLVIRSSKLERYENKFVRSVPISPELKALLTLQFEQATKQDAYVICRYRRAEANLRTQARRITTLAGIVPWEKTFANLRASCVTDWAEVLPRHACESFAGHSEAIADAHYRMTLDSHYTTITKKGESISESLGVQKANQHQPASSGTERQEMPKAPGNQGLMLSGPSRCEPMRRILVHPTGVELDSASPLWDNHLRQETIRLPNR